jgi:hypothetical protein
MIKGSIKSLKKHYLVDWTLSALKLISFLNGTHQINKKTY